jgi:flagellar biosynthesis protein FlhB
LASEKTIPATPRRRQQAREEGRVAHSYDLASAAILVAGIVILLTLGANVAEFFGRLVRQQLAGESWLSHASQASSADFIVEQFRSTVTSLTAVLAPVLGLLMVVAAAIHLIQTGFLWLPERISPDLGRINPLAGLQRMFSLASAVRLSLGIIKFTLVFAIGALALYHQRLEIPRLASLEPRQLAPAIVSITLWTSLKIAVALAILAICDYGYEYWKLERDLRMTPEELREEMKSFEGNPQIRSRLRRMQGQSPGQADLVPASFGTIGPLSVVAGGTNAAAAPQGKRAERRSPKTTTPRPFNGAN